MAGRIPETVHRPGFPGSSFKYTPLRHIRVLFVRFCQGLFGAAPVGGYRWTDDPETSEIYIADGGKVDGEVINRRPAITFTRSTIQMSSIGIDDRDNVNFRTGTTERKVLVPGTTAINVVSRVESESEDIAWVVMEHVWLLGHLLLQAGGLYEVGRQAQLSAVSPAGSIVTNDSGQEAYLTTVVVPWQMSRSSQFTPLGKEIAGSIAVKISAASTPPQPQGSAYHPFEIPVHVDQTNPPSFAPMASDSKGGTPSPALGGVAPQPPKQYHPLNPAVEVTVRQVRPFGAR